MWFLSTNFEYVVQMIEEGNSVFNLIVKEWMGLVCSHEQWMNQGINSASFEQAL